MTPPRAAVIHCRAILRASGSSFAAAFGTLPPGPRAALTAFYAFCRLVDDAVDEAPDRDAARAVLADWRRRIAAVYSGGKPDEPVDEALGWAVACFPIRREHLELILDGVEEDLDVRRFERFADVVEYCRRVASAVGYVCVSVLAGGLDGAETYADLTGVAVQLTNILRDVGEDAARGRLYLPLEDLRAFGVAPDDVLRRRPTARLLALLRFEAERARSFYALAAAALPPAAASRLFFCEALRETYARLLERLVARDLPVLTERVALGPREKIAIALGHRLGLPWLGRIAA